MNIPTEFRGVFGCGHEGTASLDRVPLAKRFARIAFLEERGSCSECRRKERVKELAAEGREAGVWAQSQGLPELTGSEKQKLFGEQERRELIMDAWRELVTSGHFSEEEFESEVLGRARLVRSARFWIDSRSSDPADLVATLDTAVSVQAAAWEAAMDAARIQGTDRQVPWATDVRFELVQKARQSVVPGTLTNEEFSETIEVPAAKINAATWWLDIKDAPAEALGELIAAAGDDAFIENVEE